MISKLQVAQVIADTLQARLQLAQAVTVVEAPPSTSVDYPAAAVWLERFTHNVTQDDELLVDPATGLPAVGATMDISLIGTAGVAFVNSDTVLHRVGTARGMGRIWVGARLPPKREELETRVSWIFYDDDGAPSRLLIKLERPRLGPYVLPWPWYVAAFVEEDEWTDEYAFGERLWSWTHYTVDIDILVPRGNPLMKTMQLLLSNDLSVNVLQPSDINLLSNLEKYSVSQTGDITKTA